MDEFSLIKKYFHQPLNQSHAKANGLVLGIGDDAAVFDVPPNCSLVSSMDTLLEGVHFPAACDPGDIAYKALAVNLSDLAAMGARAHSFTLSLCMPGLDEPWLQAFSEALFALANEYQVALIGGDTTKGPLAITIQVNGMLEKGCFLSRQAARPGDYICVTGYPGLAALGLKQWQKQCVGYSEALRVFYRPVPRLDFAQGLWALGVRCAIDISDGLLSELRHLVEASQLAAHVDVDTLPLHKELAVLPLEERRALMLSGGDDYELCLAVPESRIDHLLQWAATCQLALTVIGRFDRGEGLHLKDSEDTPVALSRLGYSHF